MPADYARSIAHPALPATPPRSRGVFCNRTLNLRSIRAVGFDMDYTLVHYRVLQWEERAYEYIRARLLSLGWPVADLRFDPDLVVRGLVIDRERGNIVKPNRFGWVKRAYHGARPLDFDAQRTLYGGTLVDLAEPRWEFLNTFFSISEGCMYLQLVDLLDERLLPGVMGYGDLYTRVRRALDAAHMEGQLKAEIMADPDRFVEPDPELALTLLDLRASGKKLLLITNSEWKYTRAMMSHAFDGAAGPGTRWTELFDLVVVGARKPEFFSSHQPLLEVVVESAEDLFKPRSGPLRPGGVYLGGNAAAIEEFLGFSGDGILYVGDHIYGDVHFPKSMLRWRTALVLRELEEEVRVIESFAESESRLASLMAEKERLEWDLSRTRLVLQRIARAYGPRPDVPAEVLQLEINALRARLVELDNEISPLARDASELFNVHWGLLLRAGNDKSHLARQIERHADIYMSRVSNLLHLTPFAYLRSQRGSMPHDPDTTPTDPFRDD